ncbi:MAG: histidine phosphatase family protein [Nitrospirae bacterium]|nr:histidine phosphatase family protein [Nitrospirota bacterium]
MVTTLYLIRHGETAGGETKTYKGSLDVPLSDNGIRQVEQSAAFVLEHIRVSSILRQQSYLRDIHTDGPEINGERQPSARLDAVYTSDLGRAVKSGEIIAAPHNVIPVSMPELRERNFGVWEGMSFIEIRDQFPGEFDAWAGNPLKFSPVGGESTLEVNERVLDAMGKILSAHRGETIAIVAHGGVNRIVLCHVLGMPLENIFRIEQDHAAVNVIEFWGETPVVKLINGGVNG